VYVRCATSVLMWLRDFNMSVNLINISYKNSTLLVPKEKAEYSQTGYRLIPLCDVIKELLKEYIYHLKYFKLLKVKDLQTNRIGMIVRDDTKDMKFIDIKPKSLLNYKEFENIDLKFLKAANLNVGRHHFMTLAINMQMNFDYVKAFYGHYTAGGEYLGKFSCNDNKKSKEHIISILNQLSKELNIKAIKIEKK